MTIVSEIQYFPSIYLYSAISRFQYVSFEIYENFQKGGFRSRCEVEGAAGVLQMHIPLSGGREQRERISDVKIDNREPWQRTHFRTLVACYSRSPFFEYYKEDLERLYEAPASKLVTWNLNCFKWTLQQLKLTCQVEQTTEYRPAYKDTEFFDIRGKMRPSSKGFPGIREVAYQQVFDDRQGFVPGLSILDLLFCEGPRSMQILQEMHT